MMNINAKICKHLQGYEMLDYLIRYIVTEINNEHMKSVSVFLQVSTTTGLLSYLVIKII